MNKHFLVRNLFIGGNSHDFTQTLGSIFRVMSFSHIQTFQEKHVGLCANVAFCMNAELSCRDYGSQDFMLRRVFKKKCCTLF